MVVFASCSFMTVGNALKKDETQNKQICKRQPSWISTSANQKWFRLPGFFPAGDFPCGVFFPSRKTRFFPGGFPVRKTCCVCRFLCFFVSFYSVFYFTFFLFPPLLRNMPTPRFQTIDRSATLVKKLVRTLVANKVILGRELSKSVKCFRKTQTFRVYDPSSL